ncbi:MAG TPA: hypothetical protein VMR70_01120 [Flavisolibacter sp.]|nr:hypothetical protein [Flavisolibacter sp.]
MKRFLVCFCFCVLTIFPARRSCAQVPVLQVIAQAVKKVIKAIDLKIQRLQNKTIWLQNAQKTLENKMQELKLGEISDWVEKQRKLYADYYEELWKVKAAIGYYSKVKGIMDKQLLMLREYKKAIALFKRDEHFSSQDIAYMEQVYAGMLNQSVKHLDELGILITSFATQMSDGKRLELIRQIEGRMDGMLTDLRKFNQQNIRLSLQRARDVKEVEVVKSLYGIK